MRQGAFVFAVASLIACGGTVRAHAWGSSGHRIVAEIAEQYLAPEAARQVHELLALENKTSLAEVANWADDIRTQRPQTARWHYVDIPIHPAAGEPNGYSPTRDCLPFLPNCVVAKVDDLTADLHVRKQSATERLETLKFLVHLIGDIHQPLHAANDNDHGGNDVKLTFHGHATNLHAVWDSGILEVAAASGDERAYALRLARSITPQQIKLWSLGSGVWWANESHRIAERVIYGVLPRWGALPDGYEDVALPIVNEQLEKAGIRLATTLNLAFR